MKVHNIIFSEGFEFNDNIYMRDYKGFRPDILVEDSSGSFFAMGFESLANVTSCLYDFRYTYIDISDPYYTYDDNGKINYIRDAFRYWIILEEVHIKAIFETIKKLEATSSFKLFKPIPTPSAKERKKWTIIPFEGYEKNAFYLEVCSEIGDDGESYEV